MVELNGALSNPSFKEETLPPLAELKERLLSGAPKRRRRSTPVKPRTGQIAETVRAVLLLAGKPMAVKDIHRAVEELLKQPVRYLTIKDILVRPRTYHKFEHVAHGLYQLKPETVPYGLVIRRRRHSGPASPELLG